MILSFLRKSVTLQILLNKKYGYQEKDRRCIDI